MKNNQGPLLVLRICKPAHWLYFARSVALYLTVTQGYRQWSKLTAWYSKAASMHITPYYSCWIPASLIARSWEASSSVFSSRAVWGCELCEDASCWNQMAGRTTCYVLEQSCVTTQLSEIKWLQDCICCMGQTPIDNLAIIHLKTHFINTQISQQLMHDATSRTQYIQQLHTMRIRQEWPAMKPLTIWMGDNTH